MNPIKDVSIEYAHIYTNNKIGEEQKISLEILNEVKESLGEQSHSLVVLVDDYSFPDPSFDYNTFAEWLKDNGHAPDLILRESQLIPVCDEVLNEINDLHLKEQISDYIRSKKYPCSLFIASWYLLRLGYLSSNFFPRDQTAKRIINILPESFRPFEERAMEILEVTKFKEVVKDIEYKYLKGRLMA